jgi:hypothetical protein
MSDGDRAGDDGSAEGYAALVGVVLVVLGLLGFIPNPIVGEQANHPLFVTGTVHNVVHLLTGVLALAIAFGPTGRAQVQAVGYFGALYAGIFLGLLVSPNLLGLLGDARYHVDVPGHVLHAGLAVTSFAVWHLARRPLEAPAG